MIVRDLIDSGPSTSGEVLARIKVDNINAWRARFTELQARGLIVEIGERACKITGKTALVWEFTARTKPLSVKKGHRVDGKAWKVLALELWRHAVTGGSVLDLDKFRERIESMQ